MNLEQLRKRAKDRLRELRAEDPDAKLSAAQLAIAREQGFRSWPRMKAYVDRLTAHGDGLQFAYHDDLAYYRDRADGLLASARDGTVSARRAFEATGLPLTRPAARRAVALAHGFPSWPALRRHVARLADSDEPFQRAHRAVEARDAGALSAVTDRWPEVVAMEGTNGNDLLGMATSNRDRATVELLLARGADPAHANAHGWTALHQTGYGNSPVLARLLLEAGAPAGAFGRGDGGTPLVAALFWGHREVTQTLLAEGVLPRNLRAAAGSGDLALIHELLGTADAGAHRAFYRPHAGFPEWRPSDDAQEVLDEALAYAARSDRTAAIEALVDAGARVDADVYRGTPLIWAAFAGRADATRALLGRGADPDGRGDFGGPDHGAGVMPLHLAAQSGAAEVAELLLAAGADASRVDGHGYGAPEGWARFGGHPALAARLREAARAG